jgi:hypothetical protein
LARDHNFSNRRMRTRMSGGVGGERRANRRPLSRLRLLLFCRNPLCALAAL